MLLPLPQDWRKHILGAADTAAARFFNTTEMKVLKEDEFDGWVPCDQAAAAFLIRPQVALKTSTHHVRTDISS